VSEEEEVKVEMVTDKTRMGQMAKSSSRSIVSKECGTILVWKIWSLKVEMK
jgi:hypothetical protein